MYIGIGTLIIIIILLIILLLAGHAVSLNPPVGLTAVQDTGEPTGAGAMEIGRW